MIWEERYKCILTSPHLTPGGMERHTSTLYSFLAARGHEIHVFTVSSDRKPHEDIHGDNLHVYFAANDHGTESVDYVHT